MNAAPRAQVIKLGKTIRAIRNRQGLSLKAVAEKVPTDKGSLSRLENARVTREPHVDFLRRLAEALGVPLTDLIDS